MVLVPGVGIPGWLSACFGTICQVRAVAETYILISWAAVNSTNDRGCVVGSPRRPGKVIGFLGILFEKILDWTRDLFDLARQIKEIHFIVLLSHFIWQAAGPSLDLVQFVFLLIVPCLANV